MAYPTCEYCGKEFCQPPMGDWNRTTLEACRERMQSELAALRKENERLREDFRALVERVCGVLDVSGTHNGLRLWQAIETVMEPHKHLIWGDDPDDSDPKFACDACGKLMSPSNPIQSSAGEVYACEECRASKPETGK